MSRRQQAKRATREPATHELTTAASGGGRMEAFTFGDPEPMAVNPDIGGSHTRLCYKAIYQRPAVRAGKTG